MTVYVALKIKKLVLTEDDTIVTQITYSDISDLPSISLEDQDILLFWAIMHSEGGKTPIFLDEEGLDRYVRFDFVQKNTDWNEIKPVDYVPFY